MGRLVECLTDPWTTGLRSIFGCGNYRGRLCTAQPARRWLRYRRFASRERQSTRRIGGYSNPLKLKVRNRTLSTFERHFSVTEIAELWGWSDDTVCRRFRHEPGVLVISYQERRKGDYRPYAKLSIPESVVVKVHERLAVKDKS